MGSIWKFSKSDTVWAKCIVTINFHHIYIYIYIYILQDKQQGMSQSLFYTVFHGRTIHQESWTGTVHHNTISHLHTQHIDRFAHKILNWIRLRDFRKLHTKILVNKTYMKYQSPEDITAAFFSYFLSLVCAVCSDQK